VNFIFCPYGWTVTVSQTIGYFPSMG